jgi:hypothetical protein
MSALWLVIWDAQRRLRSKTAGREPLLNSNRNYVMHIKALLILNLLRWCRSKPSSLHNR